MPPCLDIRSPRKNSLLVGRVPGVQWVIIIVLGWHLASLQSRNSERPENAGGFVWLDGRRAIPSQTARWLVQVCVQGEGEAKAPSYRAHRLTLPYQLRIEKGDGLVPSHSRANYRATSYESPTFTVLPDPTPRCSAVRRIRAETKQSDIHDAAS